MPEKPDGDRPRLPDGMCLTDAESEVARRWFAGRATEEELREVIASHLDRLIVAGAIQVYRSGESA